MNYTYLDATKTKTPQSDVTIVIKNFRSWSEHKSAEHTNHSDTFSPSPNAPEGL